MIRIESQAGVSFVTMDRPPVNALSSDLISALAGAFAGVATDPACRVVVLTGSGKAFSAGGDIPEMASLEGPHARRTFVDRGQKLCDTIAASTRPVIAAIEGHCLGGGLELALACHLRVVGEGARLSQPEAGLGLLPGFGGTQRLPRLIGESRALELLLTAEVIDAQRAHELGLANRVVPAGGALEAARELARGIASLSSAALAGILAVFASGRDEPLRDALDAEMNAFVALLGGPDARARMKAFLEKRRARPSS